MGNAKALVAAARGWIGTPYLHQASTKGAGTDCLGLIRGIWRELIGHEPEPLPAYSQDWSEVSRQEVLALAATRWLCPVPLDQVRLGDVLLFRMREGSVAKHLGINSRLGPEPAFIHAYSGHGVIETPLSDPWRRKIIARFQFPEGV